MGCILVFCFTPTHSMGFMAPISRLVKCIILQGFQDDSESKDHTGFLIKFPAFSLLVGEFRANLISSSPGYSSDLLSRSLDHRSESILCLELHLILHEMLLWSDRINSLASLIAHHEEGNCAATRVLITS